MLLRFTERFFLARNGKRFLSTSSSVNSSYEPDGQTTVSILNQEKGAPLMINSYSQMGFRLNNGLFVIGPTVIFPRSVLSWNVKDDLDINEDSLSFFTNLHPKLDILVIGLSQSTPGRIRKLDETIMQILRKMKLNIEILPTDKACTTFNFLNSEQRFVAGALIPPIQLEPSDDEVFRLSYRRQEERKADFLT